MAQKMAYDISVQNFVKFAKKRQNQDGVKSSMGLNLYGMGRMVFI